MKTRLRGASHLALIATLSVMLGFSTLTLAAAAKSPQDIGGNFGKYCSGAGKDCVT